MNPWRRLGSYKVKAPSPSRAAVTDVWKIEPPGALKVLVVAGNFRPVLLVCELILIWLSIAAAVSILELPWCMRSGRGAPGSNLALRVTSMFPHAPDHRGREPVQDLPRRQSGGAGAARRFFHRGAGGICGRGR